MKQSQKKMIKIEDDCLILPNGPRVKLLRIKGISRVRKMKEYKKTGKYGFYVYQRSRSHGNEIIRIEETKNEAIRFMFQSEFEAYTAQALLNNIWQEALRKRTRKRTY